MVIGDKKVTRYGFTLWIAVTAVFWLSTAQARQVTIEFEGPALLDADFVGYQPAQAVVEGQSSGSLTLRGSVTMKLRLPRPAAITSPLSKAMS